MLFCRHHNSLRLDYNYMEYAANRKIENYRHLGYVIPFCVGSLGSWYSGNPNSRDRNEFSFKYLENIEDASIKESMEVREEFYRNSSTVLSRFIILLSILSCIFSLLTYSLTLNVFITKFYCQNIISIFILFNYYRYLYYVYLRFCFRITNYDEEVISST